jgi:hypothetical protein
VVTPEEEDRAMATNNIDEPLKVGTWVRILNSRLKPGRIVEFRGPLGPGGARVYRVKLRGKPYPAYTEVLEDQLEVVPKQS